MISFSMAVAANTGQEHWLSYTCPHCLSILEIDGNWSGQVVGCPSCGGNVQLPRLGDPGLKDRRCTWCGLRASFMGFRANGQFICPGCRAAIDKTPEISRAMSAGPVSVVVPKVSPEKRAKQATQQIRLPSKASKAEAPSSAPPKPASEGPRPAAAGPIAWRKPTPVASPPKVQSESKKTVPVPQKPEAAAASSAIAIPESKPPPESEAPPPRPGKEYAKFFSRKGQGSAAPSAQEPAALREERGEAKADPALAARRAQREKPQGFPWMVQERGIKKEELVSPVMTPQAVPSALAAVASPSGSKKKATDVIPSLGGLRKNVPPAPAQIVRPPRAAGAEPPKQEGAKPPARPPSERVPPPKSVPIPPPKTVPAAAVLAGGKRKSEDAGSAHAQAIRPTKGEAANTGAIERSKRATERPEESRVDDKSKRPQGPDAHPTPAHEENGADWEPAWLDSFAKKWVQGNGRAPELDAVPLMEEEAGAEPDLASTETDVSDRVTEERESPDGEEPEPAEETPAQSSEPGPETEADELAAQAEYIEEEEGADEATPEEEEEPRFGPSTMEANNGPSGGFQKGADSVSQSGERQVAGGSSGVSARVLRLADVISGAASRSAPSSPLGRIWDWIEDHLPLLLVTSLLLTVGVTVYALWRSAEGKAISEVGFRTTADFQTYQKGMALVRRGKIREAVELIRAPATRVSADPGLRSFYFELRAAEGDQPSTPEEIAELLKSRESGSANVARILAWESAWHHPDIDGRMRSVKVLTKLGLVHRLPLAEREVRQALGDSAEAALGTRPAGLDGYRWDERFVRWYYLKAATGDNSARDRLIQWIKDPQTDRIRREAASLALLELDEPDAEKIVHDVWQQEQTRIEAINFRVTTSRALGIDGGKLPPGEVRRIREWATKELGLSIARAFGLLYEHGIPAGLELLDNTARNDGVYGFPAMAAVAELNRVLGGKALARMSAIREYWKSELDKLRADPKEASSEVGQTFQKVMGRIIEAVTIEMARAGDANAVKEVTAGLSSENDFEKVQAALKLGERGLELAMPVLVTIAQGAEKPVASQEERKEAKRILLENGQGATAKSYLEGLLPDPDEAVRFGAATRLLELQVEAQPRAMPAADLAPAKPAK